MSDEYRALNNSALPQSHALNLGAISCPKVSRNTWLPGGGVQLPHSNFLSRVSPTLFTHIFSRKRNWGPGAGGGCARNHMTILLSTIHSCSLQEALAASSFSTGLAGSHFLRNLSHKQIHLIGLVGFRGRSGLPFTCLRSLLLGRDFWINWFPHDPVGKKAYFLREELLEDGECL